MLRGQGYFHCGYALAQAADPRNDSGVPYVGVKVCASGRTTQRAVQRVMKPGRIERFIDVIARTARASAENLSSFVADDRNGRTLPAVKTGI